ncbi:hypothetical protein KIL84_001533 [Mauremys mutica]|uniref:Uncharacterized protein n=1 Tax=Mauremys mutica TaxID=74926 RepID=A0A9D4B4Y3_9SAUR|nr:hypothetical protein KIL84_001533 [Mauremys mutica]
MLLPPEARPPLLRLSLPCDVTPAGPVRSMRTPRCLPITSLLSSSRPDAPRRRGGSKQRPWRTAPSPRISWPGLGAHHMGRGTVKPPLPSHPTAAPHVHIFI